MGGRGGDAERRVLRELPAGAIEALERDLSPTDLSTLLLAVARARSSTVQPSDLLRRWQADRFVRPSTADPRELTNLEARIWRMLPADVSGVELSPVAPLGTSAAVSSISQNRVVSTVRGTEVVSDSTNALALEAAIRRRTEGRASTVHLATAHRQLRAQYFGEGMPAHFRLFALVSSARDTGTGRTEARLVEKQIRFWLAVLREFIPDALPRVELTYWDEGRAASSVRDHVRDWIGREDLGHMVVEVPERTHAHGYYEGVALRLTALDGHLNLGDGGLTRWTAQLLGDAKERCLVSCIATERLLSLVSAAR
ncbi:MAG: hypothetical protein Q8M73_11225 [Actinomycetota bacterium]|nr:hypothetical protein [Actinomycetota bacterium]